MSRSGGEQFGGGCVAMGSDVGTHMDALCHFSCGGMSHGGHAVEDLQSYGGGLKKYSVDTVEPIAYAGEYCSMFAGDGGPLAEDSEIAPRHVGSGAEDGDPARRRECCCARDGRATSRTRGSS